MNRLPHPAAAGAFQDDIPNNYCFGCGTLNPDGLHIKSHWADGAAVCTWKPSSHHMAGPRQILNGGIIATVIDCHTVCTAIADAYTREGRAIGDPPELWYATAQLNIRYLRPTPIDRPVTLWAEILEVGARKTVLRCHLSSEGEDRVAAEVVAVRVPPTWREV